jgi:hypothetical protein
MSASFGGFRAVAARERRNVNGVDAERFKSGARADDFGD